MRSQRLKKRKKSQRKRRKAKRVANEKRKAVERNAMSVMTIELLFLLFK